MTTERYELWPDDLEWVIRAANALNNLETTSGTTDWHLPPSIPVYIAGDDSEIYKIERSEINDKYVFVIEKPNDQ